MASATAATHLKFPSRDELGIEDILDSPNMSEEDVTSLRAAITRAGAKVPAGSDFFDLPWFRVLAAQKTVNSLSSFRHHLQQSPVNLKSGDPALAPYDEWIRLMKETVDVAQQQMEAELETQKEMAKTRKDEEYLGLKKQVPTVDDVEKGRDDEKKRKPNTLAKKIAGAFAADLGSDSEVQERAEAEQSMLEQGVPVARKKEGKAAAHFKGLRTIAREAEPSMKARQQWPEPRTGMNVVVTKPVRSIRTQNGFYKLEWPAKWGWGPRADGTTNFI